MDFLKLKATLGLDSSEYEKGLNDAKSSASSIGGKIGNALGGAVKLAGKAIVGATTAVTAFGASSVKVGMNFDSAMSQVAATMGSKANEMVEYNGEVVSSMDALRDFAQEMGRTTAFSATQSADALNYMALAGYDAQTSMEMLPNVLNLAAAGGMDLARASDMVTDTQTAFGISLERTSQLVDEMAKAASTGNTSVEQLGDAFLTVGGLAQELNGGFVQTANGAAIAVDGTQELEIALTAMANAGIKGSEAGTHMRNMLLKLSSPTDDGTAALEAMGVTVFDTEGKMRSLSSVFGDLSDAMSTMTQEQKIQTISDLFNTRDLASAEALLNAVSSDWDDIGVSILEAQIPLEDTITAMDEAGVAWEKFGATSDQSIEKLAGDIRYDLTTAGMSAQDAARDIADAYDVSMQDALQAVEAVQHGLENTASAAELMKDTQLDNLTGSVTLFKSALEGAQIAISDVLSPTLKEFVDFGTNGLSELTGAFQEGGLSGAMEAFGTILSDGLNMIISKLPEAVNAGMQLLGALGQGLLSNMPVIIDAAVQIIGQLVKGMISALPALADGALQIIVGLANGISEMLPELIPTIVDVVLQIVQTLIDNIPLLIDGAIQLMLGLIDGIIQALPIIIERLPEILQSIMTAIIESLPIIMDALMQLVMAIAENLPTIIQALVDALPQLIDIWISSLLTFYPLLIDGLVQLVLAIVEHLPEIIQALVEAIPQIITSIVNTIIENGPQFLTAITSIVMSIIQLLIGLGQNLIQTVATNMQTLVTTVVTWISQLPAKVAYWVGEMVAKFINILLTLPMKAMLVWTNFLANVKSFGTKLINEGPKMASEFGQRLINKLMELPSKMIDVGRNIVEGLKNGISNAWTALTDWVKDLCSNLVKGFTENLKINSPSKVFRDEVGQWIPAGIAEGIEQNAGILYSTIDDLASNIVPATNPLLSSMNNLSLRTAGNNQSINVYVTLEGDADRLFRVVQAKAVSNHELTGKTAISMG